MAKAVERIVTCCCICLSNEYGTVLEYAHEPTERSDSLQHNHMLNHATLNSSTSIKKQFQHSIHRLESMESVIVGFFYLVVRPKTKSRMNG
mmetsp:Transcript_22164/g.40703  ORF Transcript_22164/g.40703 Transcript_22164/m.40703 type:complete len:91 (-) Transcript_22164:94-366(-)